MIINKQTIIEQICYTPLVYERINKKLQISLTKKQVEVFIINLLKETDSNSFIKSGKNIYVANLDNNIRITINSNTFRVITVDKLKKA